MGEESEQLRQVSSQGWQTPVVGSGKYPSEGHAERQESPRRCGVASERSQLRQCVLLREQERQVSSQGWQTRSASGKYRSVGQAGWQIPA